jgi:hypothetical protein
MNNECRSVRVKFAGVKIGKGDIEREPLLW